VSIDVTVRETIRKGREAVADYVFDHRNDPVWIGGITESELMGSEPLGTGSDVRRVASFMGRRIDYVLRVQEMERGRRLMMRSVKAPFPMVVTYAFEDAEGGEATVASVRVQGEPGLMYKLAGPLLARQVRTSVSDDLETLKGLLERV
jgi:hypothetical protein